MNSLPASTPLCHSNGNDEMDSCTRVLLVEDNVIYIGLMHQMLARAKDESFVLDWTSQLKTGGADITSWLEWFLGCLGRAVAGAEKELGGVLRKAKTWEGINAQPVNDRQRKIINLLIDGFDDKLSTSKYAKLAKCSEDTALRDIKILIERGILVQDEGGGRSTSYRLAENDKASQ